MNRFFPAFFSLSLFCLLISGCSDSDSNSCKTKLDIDHMTPEGECLLSPSTCEMPVIEFEKLSDNEKQFFFQVCDPSSIDYETDPVFSCLKNADVCDAEYIAFDTLSDEQKCLFFPKLCDRTVEDGTCSNPCKIDALKCSGKTLMKCTLEDGCNIWKAEKSCTTSCSSDFGKCLDDLPTCTLKPGAKGTIIQWTDADTLWVKAKTDGTCNDYEYSENSSGKYSWKPVRYDIRMDGIDAPECSKQQNQNYYYECIKDATYTGDNEPMGYEAWQKAMAMLPAGTEITLSCDAKENDGTCGKDTTGSRYLTFLGYTQNNASYDYSIEIVRNGMAFSNTYDCSKRKAICNAQTEAQNAKRGVWSLASTQEGVFDKMVSSKQSWIYKMPNACKKAK